MRIRLYKIMNTSGKTAIYFSTDITSSYASLELSFNHRKGVLIRLIFNVAFVTCVWPGKLINI